MFIYLYILHILAAYSLSESNDCPLACSTNTYAVELSQSQLSYLNMADLIGNDNADVTSHYTAAMEMQHRVTDSYMVDTIRQFNDVIDNQQQMSDYIYFTVIDQGTSEPAHVETAVQAILQLATIDIVQGGGSMFASFKVAYEQNIEPALSYVYKSAEESYSALGIVKGVLAFNQIQPEKIPWYTQIFNATISALSDFDNSLLWFQNDFINSSVVQNYMNTNIFSNCVLDMNAVDIQVLSQTLENVMSKMLNFTNHSTLLSSFLMLSKPSTDMQVAINALIGFIQCTKQYGLFLIEVQAWINSLDFTCKNFSNSINGAEMLLLFGDYESWFQSLLNSYSQNTISKSELASQICSPKQLDLMEQVAATVSDIDQLIVVPVEAAMNGVQQKITDAYVRMLQYITRFDYFISSPVIDTYARSLQIWRKPVPNLESPEVIFI